MIEAMWSGFAQLIEPAHFGMLCLGVGLGILIGIIPGVGGTVGFALLLPFVYRLSPTGAIAVLIGMCAVTVTADTITCVLLAIPGTSGSVATIVDGHQCTVYKHNELGSGGHYNFSGICIFLYSDKVQLANLPPKFCRSEGVVDSVRFKKGQYLRCRLDSKTRRVSFD